MSNAHTSRGGTRTTILILLALGAIGTWAWWTYGRDSRATDSEVALTKPLVRGPMRVTISEAGSLEALDAHKVLNKVEGRNTIDYIVPEGTVLTEEDIRKGTVIVRLNTAEIEEKRIRQEIEVAAAVDAHANATTNLEIQIHQNASDMRKADLSVHFARLDLKRYVGEPFALKLLASYEASVAASIQDASGNGPSPRPPETPGDGTPGNTAPGNRAPGNRAPGNGGSGEGGGSDEGVGLASQGLRRLISSLLDSEGLDGEALQRIRDLDSEILLSKEDQTRALEKKKQSEALLDKGYVSEDEYEQDRLALMRSEIREAQAETARSQFVEYDFPKQVARLLSDLVEAEDGMTRVGKKADAAEAQKRSALIAKEKQKELKLRRLDDFNDMEASCVLRATVAGLVVYASSGNERRWGNQERIDVGASVRQGQELITIPSPKSLGARISVHETFIDRVKKGQEAWITVDAMPGVRIPARVKTVARLPNPADRWLNPDLKVYTTILEFKDEQPDLKPGMSAQVEILIKHLGDVIAAPIQSVAGTVEDPAVYVWTEADGVQRRTVKLGLASEHFVEITEGLSGGERLLLDPPREKRKAPTGAKSAGGQSEATPPGKKPSSKGKPGTGQRGGAKGRKRKGAPTGKADGRTSSSRKGGSGEGASRGSGSRKKGRSESR